MLAYVDTDNHFNSYVLELGKGKNKKSKHEPLKLNEGVERK